MQWYEILLAIPVILIGAYIHMKIIQHKKDYFKNGSWKNRNKRS